MPTDAYEDVEFEVTAPRVRPQSISTMSSLLLQGYAMLADSCETCGVPLMRKPNSDEVICVNCGAPEPEETSAAPLLPNGTSANGLSDIVEPAPPPLRERIAAHRASTQSEATTETVDTSQAIADKMLAGWALMAEHCPCCSTPLVRSREGRIYCVSCQLYAKRENEAAPVAPAPAAPAASAAVFRSSLPALPTPIVQTTAPRFSAAMTSSGIAASVTEASAAVAARLASTARRLDGASAAEAAAALSEIQMCVEALQGMRVLLQD